MVMSGVTRILDAIEMGDPQAAAELLPLVYDELRKLASQKLAREKPGQTLQATALVHEAYLRLVESFEPASAEKPQWVSRRHFFAAAAEAMRRILVENARRRRRLKHGGGLERVELSENFPAIEEPIGDVLGVDEALGELAGKDSQTAELVKLHYFAGLTIEQAAEILKISPRTAYRSWAYARAWLYRRLGRADSPSA
jgi:RNA polymerase sigma factor (TIGR02999 family)